MGAWPASLHDLATAYLVEEARATLRHALRNKLGAVRNAAFFIRKRVEAKTTLATEEARVPQFFGIIEDEIVAATKITETTIEAPSSAARANAKTVLEGLVRAMNAPVELAVPADLEAAIDPLELELAAFCLLDNAIESGARALVTARRDDEKVVIVVDDEGPGLSPEVQLRAFEAFFTTKPGRQGLGLTIARRIAIRWSGTVDLKAASGKGARATLGLPAGGAP